MIKEDYVSFEVAKLLKENGFDERGLCVYVVDSKELLVFGDWAENSCLLPHLIAAPTLQMAMKWLREVHNIMVSPYALSLGYYFEIFDLANRDITGCKPLYQVGIPYKEDVLSTYEEACEAAIKYILENLI